MAAGDSTVVEIIKIITDSQRVQVDALKDLSEVVRQHDKQAETRIAEATKDLARIVATVEACTKDVVTLLQKIQDEVQGDVGDDMQQLLEDHKEVKKHVSDLSESVVRLFWVVGIAFTIAMLAFAYIEFH